MGGSTKKPSGRGRKNSDKQPAHPPGMGKDPAYPPFAQYQQLKEEQDSDDAAYMASLANPSGNALTHFGPSSQTAAASPSTPGHLVSSSPMAPLSSSSAQMVLPAGRRKTGQLICWNYTNKPVPYKGNGNGRQRGRNLIQWIRPRMYEKLLLHLQYELNRHDIAVPWDYVAHRFHPGSSGAAILQHLNRIRPILLAEGHLVPPLCRKPGSKKAVPGDIRGYIRADPDGDDCVSTRPVPWTEPVFDRQFNLPNAHDDKSISGSVKRYQMGGEHVYPARKDKNELKRKPEAARLALTESAKKTRRSSRRSSSAANYVEHDGESDFEQDEQVEPTNEQWVGNEDADGEYEELFSSPSHGVPILDYGKQTHYRDQMSDDDVDEFVFQRAARESRNDAPTTVRRSIGGSAQESGFGQSPAKQGSSPVKLEDDGWKQAALLKKQCDLLRQDKQTRTALHQFELAHARQEGIHEGFKMARENPQLLQPILPSSFESPGSSATMAMRPASMLGNNARPTPAANNPPSTPISNDATMPSYSPAIHSSPSRGATTPMFSKPLPGPMRTPNRSMTSTTMGNPVYGGRSTVFPGAFSSFQRDQFPNQTENTASGSVPFSQDPDVNLFGDPSVVRDNNSQFQLHNAGAPMNNFQTTQDMSSMQTGATMVNSQLANTEAPTVDSGDNKFKASHDDNGINSIVAGAGMNYAQYINQENQEMAGDHFMKALGSPPGPSAGDGMSGDMYQDNEQDGLHGLSYKQ